MTREEFTRGYGVQLRRDFDNICELREELKEALKDTKPAYLSVREYYKHTSRVNGLRNAIHEINVAIVHLVRSYLGDYNFSEALRIAAEIAKEVTA